MNKEECFKRLAEMELIYKAYAITAGKNKGMGFDEEYAKLQMELNREAIHYIEENLK